LQAIQTFISDRTDPNRPPAEKLDAVWICVPTSDPIGGSIGGVKEILDMRQVPVIVALTKCDEVVAPEGAHARYEQACRSLFRGEPRDVPVVIVSVKVQFGDRIQKLVVTTDRLITGSRAARSGTQGAKPQIDPVHLVWSAAVRVHPSLFIQASIEVGRSRYWRSLWTSLDFADQPLKDCVNVIHTDIIEIWNLYDPLNWLSHTVFKEMMSHIVKDLAGSNRSVSPSNFAAWVRDVYQGSKENVRCVMEYTVNLNVILDDIHRSGADHVSSTHDIKVVMDKHTKSGGRRDMIHSDIHNFFKVMTFASRLKRDLVLDKIIELIWKYCPLVPS